MYMMNNSQYSSDSLYTNTNKFIIAIDSRNGTLYKNGAFNSDITFEFEQPIVVPRQALKLTCSVMAFTAPNSIYTINENNNYLRIIYNSTLLQVYIPYGNYNSTTFMSVFLSTIQGMDTTLYTGLGITLNANTNKFTITHNVYGIQFMNTSTISSLIGMVAGTTIGSSTIGAFSMTMPYTCNFTGIQNINIHIENMNTDNVDSLTKSNTNIIQTVPVDANQSQIIFNKTTDYAFTVKENVIDLLEIVLTDDLGNLINFNNQHWNMTLYFSLVEDIERFKHEKSFQHILKTGYST